MKLLILLFYYFFGQKVMAANLPLMFDSLSKFGKLNGYLVAFIYLLQVLIIALVSISLIFKAIEMLANPDVPKIISEFVNGAAVILLVIYLPTILPSIAGISGEGKNFNVGEYNDFFNSKGIAFLFSFIRTYYIVGIIIFGILAVILLIMSAINYLATSELSGFIRQFLISVMFILLTYSFSKMLIKLGATKLG